VGSLAIKWLLGIRAGVLVNCVIASGTEETIWAKRSIHIALDLV